ncbi:hypothetical protein [Acetobacter syzygii]
MGFRKGSDNKRLAEQQVFASQMTFNPPPVQRSPPYGFCPLGYERCTFYG